jgi:predicted ArsR family transcriptional regulator
MDNPDFEQSSTSKSRADVMNLPDEQRQIVNWITRQQKVTLAAVVEHINLAEEVVRQHLQTLIAAGFIHELNEDGEIYYQTRFVEKQKSKLSAKIWDKL